MPETVGPSDRNTADLSGYLIGLAILGDILLVRAWALQDLSMIRVILLHFCLALAFGVLSVLLRTRSSSAPLASFVILILLGPFGGPALLIVSPGPVPPQARLQSARPAARVSSAPQFQDAADRLFDQIRQHRRHPLPDNAVPSFLNTFGSGTLHQQQEAIAAISRSYHPNMRQALTAALASPAPALRVQAAAVYARLRGTYGDRAKVLLAQAGCSDRAQPFPDATAIAEIANSGFIDKETRSRLIQLIPGISAENPPPPGVPASSDRSARSLLRATPRLKRYACGGLG